MPVGLNSAFNIARKGLQSNLAALNITGHNIANVNTEGYTRQRIELATSFPIRLPQGIFGTGVEVAGVERIRDELVSRQFRRQNEDLGEFETLDRILNQLEVIFNEPSESGNMRIVLSKFFDDFQELSNEPESSTIRTVVRESASLLTEVFRRIDNQITILSNDIGREIEDTIGEINELGSRIADLNVKIVSLKNVGRTPNDLMDERDKALDRLSNIIDINYRETSAGSINVAVGGRSIVSDGLSVASFKTNTSSVGGNLITSITGTDDDIPLKPVRGKLKGQLNARNEVIPRYRSQLDELVSALITSVNSLHQNGVGLRGSDALYPQDNDFFAGTDAGSIDISTAVKRDVRNIAVAERVEVIDPQGNVSVTGESGNNKVALEIAQLKITLLMLSNTATFDDFLSGVVGGLGEEARGVIDNSNNQKRIVTEFQNLHESFSGVSLDEEMTKMIQFQRAYQSSARVVNVVDELFQTLLGMGN